MAGWRLLTITQQTRDRIVGGVFLLALAGIVLPMLFDGAGVAELADVKVAPKVQVSAPVVPITTTGKEWEFVAQARQHRSEPSPVSAGEAVTQDGETTALGDPRARSIDEKSPTGRELPWTVQVGSFAAVGAAKTLSARLLGDGFHAYVTQGVTGDQRPIARVAVGPIIDRSEAERVRVELQRRYGVAAILKKFDL